MMAALIAYVANLTGMNIDCATLQAGANQFACIPRQDQLPALLFLLSQPIGYGVFLFSSGGLGTPPPFAPLVTSTQYSGISTGAVATDTSTGQQWNFVNGVWQ